MNPLTNLFPETDGLGEALRTQSEGVANDRRARQFYEDIGPDTTPKDWDEKRGFERGDHVVLLADGTADFITEADCRQVKARPAGGASVYSDVTPCQPNPNPIKATTEAATELPLAVGDLVEVLPHPEGGRHPKPWMDNFDHCRIGRYGKLEEIRGFTPGGTVCLFMVTPNADHPRGN